jgi:hypothetical protein
MSQIKNIIIHCSDSLWGCARVIRSWHLEKGWSDIGYHFVIQNGAPTRSHLMVERRIHALDGQVECGRYLDDDTFLSDIEKGAHALGYNANSIGICLIGVKDFTSRQMTSLYQLLYDLTRHYQIPADQILGHCETAQAGGKTCPNLNMAKVRSDFACWERLQAGAMKNEMILGGEQP